jgi:ankyrin repeat protein
MTGGSKFMLRAFPGTVIIFSLTACGGSYAVSSLDPGRYFPDPHIARFVESIDHGDTSDVARQIKAGIDVNAQGIDGFRPIFFAFFPERPDVLNLLLASGAHPSVALKNGDTPLHFAVRKSNLGFTEALIRAGGDPNAAGEHGKPVIHEAINFANTEMLSVLKNAGANINVVWGGGTPLYNALASMSWQMAAQLLSLGADVGVTNAAGRTAADVFCFQAGRLQPTTTNKIPVLSVFDSFRRRNVPLSCADERAKFAQ